MAKKIKFSDLPTSERLQLANSLSMSLPITPQIIYRYLSEVQPEPTVVKTLGFFFLSSKSTAGFCDWLKQYCLNNLK